MTRAFGGTATTAPEGTTDWMLGPSLREKWDDPRRVAIVEWMMKVHRLKDFCCLLGVGTNKNGDDFFMFLFMMACLY